MNSPVSPQATAQARSRTKETLLPNKPLSLDESSISTTPQHYSNTAGTELQYWRHPPAVVLQSRSTPHLDHVARWQPVAWSPIRCMHCMIPERWPQALGLMHAGRQTKASCSMQRSCKNPNPGFISHHLFCPAAFPLSPLVQRRSFSCLSGAVW